MMAQLGKDLLAKIAAARSTKKPLPNPIGEIAPLPAGWRVVAQGEDGFAATNEARKLRVIVSDALEQDGRRWRHLSCSLEKRVPNYEELCLVKRIFIGDEREAYAVFPRKSHHVNIHPNCLHLWCPLDGPVLPDFSLGGISIKP
ncbi:MAG TPA: hypothetical protein VHF69_14870, partial [Candidatus Synoicihabitans sp.]|nr:hypothetical protein [Candidatus Synoicihabitans sp.]